MDGRPWLCSFPCVSLCFSPPLCFPVCLCVSLSVGVELLCCLLITVDHPHLPLIKHIKLQYIHPGLSSVFHHQIIQSVTVEVTCSDCSLTSSFLCLFSLSVFALPNLVPLCVRIILVSLPLTMSACSHSAIPTATHQPRHSLNAWPDITPCSLPSASACHPQVHLHLHSPFTLHWIPFILFLTQVCVWVYL